MKMVKKLVLLTFVISLGNNISFAGDSETTVYLSTQSGPHTFALITYGNNLSGVFYNASSSSSPLLDLRHWKAEGIKGEVYVNTTWEEVSVLFDLYGERVNFDIGNSAGRQRQFAGISSSVVYGRANIVEGSSWEFGVGLSRDARTNNSLKLSSRVGLGAGWTAFGLFTDQFSTGRTLYNSTDGYYQETKLDYSEIGVSKHLWRGIVISGSLITQNMGSDNRDAYGYDGYRAELGYYF